MFPHADGLGSPDEGVARAWIVPLQATAGTLRRMHAVLSPTERVRAARFVFERDRRVFVMSHAALRGILAACCGVKPERLRFRRGARGKPYLVDAPRGLQFNLSHCDGFCLVGVARGPAIGVDVERVRPVDDMPHLTRQCFSAVEQREFADVAPHDRERAFFNGWTRKEAFIKAVGDGLSYPLENFDVTLAPGRQPRLLAIGGSEPAAAQWTLDAHEPASDVMAAVAIAAPGYTVRWHTLPVDSGRSEMEDLHGCRRTRRHDDVSRGDEPRRTVFDLAGRP
jgi:4'-phosphopantetheinyl transferase